MSRKEVPRAGLLGRVTALRNHQGIAVFTPTLDCGNLLTLADAAKRLSVSIAATRRLATRGLIPATQAVPYAPCPFEPTPSTPRLCSRP